MWILLINLPFAENGTEEVKSICEAVENIVYRTNLIQIILISF